MSYTMTETHSCQLDDSVFLESGLASWYLSKDEEGVGASADGAAGAALGIEAADLVGTASQHVHDAFSQGDSGTDMWYTMTSTQAAERESRLRRESGLATWYQSKDEEGFGA